MQTPQYPLIAVPNILGSDPTTSSVLFRLWEHAAPHLKAPELEWIGQATEYADAKTEALQKVIETLARMVLVEAENEEAGIGTASGAFQSSNEISSLLVLIGQNLDTIRGLLLVGESAKDRFYRPGLYRNRRD